MLPFECSLTRPFGGGVAQINLCKGDVGVGGEAVGICGRPLCTLLVRLGTSSVLFWGVELYLAFKIRFGVPTRPRWAAGGLFSLPISGLPLVLS